MLTLYHRGVANLLHKRHIHNTAYQPVGGILSLRGNQLTG